MGRKKSKKQTAASRRSATATARPSTTVSPATVETETDTERSIQDVNDGTSNNNNNNDRHSGIGNNDDNNNNNDDDDRVSGSGTEQHQTQSQSQTQTNRPLVKQTPTSQNKQQQQQDGHSHLVSEGVDPDSGPGGRHVHHNEQPDPEDIGLLTSKRKSRRSQLKSGYYYDNASQRHLTSSSSSSMMIGGHRHHHHRRHTYVSPEEWQRPYWLGSTLFLILLAFWLLDSLKDPLFAQLVDGKISQHQPTAKLVSVACTLILVCCLEYLQNLRQQHEQQQQQQQQQLATTTTSSETTPTGLDDGGIWKRMPMMIGRLVGGRQRHGPKTDKRWRQLDDSPGQPPQAPPQHALDDVVSVGIFFQIGTPYVVVFSIIGYLIWKFEQQQQQELLDSSPTSSSSFQSSDHDPTSSQSWNWWYVLGYALYVSVESFGSLAVATFWSYTNSTLALDDAERYYGPIIATAQLGAIAGSTLVASGRWNAPVLFAVVSMTIVLQLIVIRLYDRKFPPTSLLSGGGAAGASTVASASITDRSMVDETQTVLTWQDNNATITKPFWSGLYLIIRHSYVLLILGVSCLYEVSMTLLDYQMKLLGFARFDSSSSSSSTDSGISISNVNSDNDAGTTITSTITFSEFMGRYGQVVNFTSLIFSSLLFPWLIRRYGLRRTLMIFPTFLLLATVLAYGAVPGNLAVLFFSLSLLKAMTYSIHDPSKELLYIPTSNAVKFRAKFWIDVVGERISKAIGSAFNTLADDVDQSVKIGSIPSVVSSLGLWVVCYYVGKRFDKLLATGKIVGLENGIDPSTYSKVPRTEELRGDGTGGGSYDVHDDDDDYVDTSHRYRTTTSEPTELELMFEEQSHVSTLDLMADPVNDATAAYRRSSCT
mmetsp:Transcript_46914/g.114434  ORF Transcript_46914/g.114434 Transcript_46914/m.114434 type:complete len:876 (-) Transcript_46914:40-2667(-)